MCTNPTSPAPDFIKEPKERSLLSRSLQVCPEGLAGRRGWGGRRRYKGRGRGKGSSRCSRTVLSCHHPAAVEHTGPLLLWSAQVPYLSFIAKPPLSLVPQIPPPPFFLICSFLPGFPRNLSHPLLFLSSPNPPPSLSSFSCPLPPRLPCRLTGNKSEFVLWGRGYWRRPQPG